MPRLSQTAEWVKPFRRAVRLSCGAGWYLREDKGSIRLEHAKQSVSLPYRWSEEGAAKALPRVQQIAKRVVTEGITLQQAAAAVETSSSQQRLDWDALVLAFKEQRPAAGDKTWSEHYLPVLNRAGQLHGKASDGTDLMQRSLEPWKQGSRMRQISRRNLAAFLSWGVGRGHLKPSYVPPAHLPEVLTPKRIGYPLPDAAILRLLDGIPDERWRFAVQLLAEYGLRPEELRWLRIRDGELWSIYRKSQGGRRGDKTEPRRLHSLPVKGAEPWHLRDRLAAGEVLPPLRTEGKAGQALTGYLNRRTVWQALKAEAEHSGEVLTGYGLRHRYARESHRAGIAVADIANAMGHTIEVHLQNYARFTPDSTARAYAEVAEG